MVASVGCSLFRVGLLSRKPLSPKHRSTFLPLQHTATLISSVDWGLGCAAGAGLTAVVVDVNYVPGADAVNPALANAVRRWGGVALG